MPADIKPLILGIQVENPRLFEALNSLDESMLNIDRLVRILNSRMIPAQLPDFANNNAARASGLKIGDFYTETGTNPRRVCIVY